MKRSLGYGTIAFLCVLAVAAIALTFAMPHVAFGIMATAAVVTEEGLAEVTKKFKEATDEVRTLGKEMLAKSEAGVTASAELKAKVDEALTKQGELKSQMTEIEQHIAKELKRFAGGLGVDENSLEVVLEKNKEALASFGQKRSQGENLQIQMSRKALVESGVTGTTLTYPGDRVLQAPLMPLQRRLTIRDLLAGGNTTSPIIFYSRETGFTNNTAPVSEGSLKPKSDITFDLVTGHVSTIANLMDISLQMLSDVAFIQSYVENRMRYGLKLVEENQLLNGSGTGQNINGLYTQATAYSHPAGAVVVNETAIDQIRLAMLQVELAFADVSGIVLNPVQWANIELTKDSQNRYIIANPQQTTTGTIWGRPVVSTQAMTNGNFLVGDFALYAQIFDRQDATLAISFENKDNFERNMATMRLEERLALAVYRPEAFVKGKLETASH